MPAGCDWGDGRACTPPTARHKLSRGSGARGPAFVCLSRRGALARQPRGSWARRSTILCVWRGARPQAVAGQRSAQLPQASVRVWGSSASCPVLQTRQPSDWPYVPLSFSVRLSLLLCLLRAVTRARARAVSPRTCCSPPGCVGQSSCLDLPQALPLPLPLPPLPLPPPLARSLARCSLPPSILPSHPPFRVVSSRRQPPPTHDSLPALHPEFSPQTPRLPSLAVAVYAPAPPTPRSLTKRHRRLVAYARSGSMPGLPNRAGRCQAWVSERDTRTMHPNAGGPTPGGVSARAAGRCRRVDARFGRCRTGGAASVRVDPLLQRPHLVDALVAATVAFLPPNHIIAPHDTTNLARGSRRHAPQGCRGRARIRSSASQT